MDDSMVLSLTQAREDMVQQEAARAEAAHEEAVRTYLQMEIAVKEESLKTAAREAKNRSSSSSPSTSSSSTSNSNSNSNSASTGYSAKDEKVSAEAEAQEKAKADEKSSDTTTTNVQQEQGPEFAPGAFPHGMSIAQGIAYINSIPNEGEAQAARDAVFDQLGRVYVSQARAMTEEQLLGMYIYIFSYSISHSM